MTELYPGAAATLEALDRATASGAIVEFGVAIPMRDGIMLRADVIRPAGDRPAPVILMRNPYGPIVARANLDPLRAVAEGFAVVMQSVRGTGASGWRLRAVGTGGGRRVRLGGMVRGAVVVQRPRRDLRAVLPGPGAALRGRRTASGPRGDGSVRDAVAPVRGHLRGRGPAARIHVRLGVRAGRRRHRTVSLDRPARRPRRRLARVAGDGRGHRRRPRDGAPARHPARRSPVSGLERLARPPGARRLVAPRRPRRPAGDPGLLGQRLVGPVPARVDHRVEPAAAASREPPGHRALEPSPRRRCPRRPQLRSRRRPQPPRTSRVPHSASSTGPSMGRRSPRARGSGTS